MFQKIWPAAVSTAGLISLAIIFFWKILLTNLILSGVDVFLYFYPYRAYVAEAVAQNRLPLWNPHLFMGVPLLANSQVGLFYPPNWLFIWLDVPKQVAWSIGFHVALAAVLMVAFARISLKLSWLPALVSAVLFAFGGYLGAQVEHLNQLQAAAWLPLLFLLYDLGLRHRLHWFWFLLLALAVALTLLAGHAQTVFISLFGLGLYGLWPAIAEPIDALRRGNLPANGLTSSHAFSRQHRFGLSLLRRLIPSLWRYLGPLGLVSLLAAALAAVQLVPTAELSGLSIRSEGLTFQEVVSFSLNPATLLYSLFPPIGLDLTRIMGQAFGEWVVYLGVSAFILAWLGIFSSVWQPTARRFVLLATTGLVLSLGVFLGPLFLFDVLVGLDSELFHGLARWSHPYYLLYRLVPGFDLFRVPARWLLLYAFGMAGLAGFGFQALLQPTLFRSKLSSVRACLQWQPIWRTGLAVVIILLILALIVWSAPPLRTLAAWLVLAGITVSLIALIVRPDSREDPEPSRSAGSPKVIPLILTALIVTELFWASQALSYNHPTAPQAYHSTRNAISFLQAALRQNGVPPGRFLSLSGITYDPGDLADLQQLFGDHLSEKALYDLVVASKEKEVLFYNLPLVYGLYSVDGYDGGILPLSKFITMQELFLPPAELSRDGRLREKLQFVPPGRLLSLLGTRWVVTDKQFDTWIDGIFYDLQFSARLAPGQSIATDEVPDFLPTAIGLVSHLEAAVGLPEGSPVARLTLTFADESRATVVLRAGQDTAEGAYPAGSAAHNQARAGVVWPYAADGVDYISVQPLPATRPITNISLEAVLPEGEFVLRGLSLIHEPTHTSRSVLLTTDGSYRQVHSGDVKIYENLSVLPRTYIVHQAEIVTDDQEALAILRHPQFEPTERLVRLRQGDMSTGLARIGHPSSRDAATIVTYEPEYVSVRATLESPGWLFLGDTYYPGWQATVDGQPVELFQANVLFRAVPVPAGEHLIEFEFKPRSLQWGALVSGLAALCLVAGLIVAGLYWPGRDQANQV